MGDDEVALVRLWREKRGEVEPEDLSGNLIVQLGSVTEALNRRWYEANTGRVITDVQKRVRHPAVRWLAASRPLLGWLLFCQILGAHFSVGLVLANPKRPPPLASFCQLQGHPLRLASFCQNSIGWWPPSRSRGTFLCWRVAWATLLVFILMNSRIARFCRDHARRS